MIEEELLDKITNSNKIAIFGWPATGKTTFSSMLSKLLNLPLYSLDNIRWQNLKNGKKDDEMFLNEYNKIISNPKWIIEGNALDWINSRFQQADIIFYFWSTPDECIKLYNDRANKITKEKPSNKDFNERLHTKSGFEEWVKNRYAKKIENLESALNDFSEKIILVKTFEEQNFIIKELQELKNNNKN